MFRKAGRNIFRYKGHYLAVGVLTLLLSVGSGVALTVRKTASQFSGLGFSGRGTGAQSFSPFGDFSRYAGIALLLLAAAGAVLFVVLTALNVRKRAGEICTCSAIGMKKANVALRFAAEIFAVTMAAAVVGTAAAYFVSAPAANALLKTQRSSLSQQMRGSGGQYNQGSGNTGGNASSGNTYGGNPEGGQTDGSQAGARQRANNNPGNGQGGGSADPAGGNSRSGNAGRGENGGGGLRGSSGGGRSFSAAPDLLVLLETLGIGAGFAVFSGGVAAVAVLGCEPMKIMNPKRG